MYVPHPRIRRLSKIPLAGTAALAALIATSVACFMATPQVAQAADAPAITDMTEQDYSDLGLGTSEDIPADTVGPLLHHHSHDVCHAQRGLYGS